MSDRPNESIEASPQLVAFTGMSKAALGDSLVAMVLYGPHASKTARIGASPESPLSLLVVVRDAKTATLDRISAAARDAKSEFGLSLMVLMEDELQRATDVFPVKFWDMRNRHTVLHGGDVLSQLVINDDDLRLRCEQELRNVLLRLRAAYLYRRDHEQRNLQHAFHAFVFTMRAFLFLVDGVHRQSDEDVVEEASGLLKLDTPVLQQLLDADRTGATLGDGELNECFGNFLAALERAVEVVDRFAARAAGETAGSGDGE